MMLALGYIAGVATCAFLFAVVAATGARRFVDRAENAVRESTKSLEDKLADNGIVILGGNITPRGFVEVPPDDDEQARLDIIAENRERGLDTPLSSLR